jgi:hypothetical protein
MNRVDNLRMVEMAAEIELLRTALKIAQVWMPLIDKNQQSELDKCRALVQDALDQTKKAT